MKARKKEPQTSKTWINVRIWVCKAQQTAKKSWGTRFKRTADTVWARKKLHQQGERREKLEKMIEDW